MLGKLRIRELISVAIEGRVTKRPIYKPKKTSIGNIKRRIKIHR